MESLYSALRTQESSTPSPDLIDLDDTWGRDLPLPELANAVVGTINLRALAAASGKLLLHAGAVCDLTGATLVLAGPSGSGKTTLTGRLIERGYGYVTDETVAASPDTLRITPYRKPLSVKLAAQPYFPEWRPNEPYSTGATREAWLLRSETLNEALAPRLLFPEMVVFPAYKRGSRPRATAVAPAAACYRLGADSSRLQDVVPSPTGTLARLVQRAPAYDLIYGDTDDAADLVEKLWAARA